jgi:hypothetical protein
VRTKDLYRYVAMVYGPSGLPGVSIDDPGVDGVFQMVSELTLTVSQAYVG